MRLLPALALLAVAALAAPTLAQPPAFGQDYQARLGVGDIPTTDAKEPAGWNIAITMAVEHTQGTATVVRVPLPAGFTLGNTSCTCQGARVTSEPGAVQVEIPANATATSGELRAAAHRSDLDPITITLDPPTTDAVVVVYVPAGRGVRANLAGTSPGASTSGTSTIHVFGESGGIPDTLQLMVGTSVVGTPTGPADPDAAPFPWLWVALAFVAGALVWAALVSRGLVQARSRKQVVAVAAHEAVAAAEPKPVLEARKRALMAALKELELARMNGELEVAAYDAVKADLKKQTVTVMRALESS